jgi:Zn-dependent metalloprotease
MSYTCQKYGHRHSIYCLIPPYVLDKIINGGDEEQRASALKTKSLDSTFRAMRLSSITSRAATPQMPTSFNASPEMSITIYDAQNQQNLPGTPVDVNTSNDDAVREAYNGLKATFEFFEDVYGRNSIDDEGMPLIATVHYDEDYNNAFWNSQQMVFGDGDGKLFNRFTLSLDVIGHELTHGVTEDEAQLVYFQQSGALNESMSDVFGSLIRQYVNKETADQADWLVGKGLLIQHPTDPENNIRTAIRSMSEPGTAFNDENGEKLLGKDPQPGHMKDYVDTFSDQGGVHINSGIPNKAFYLVATRMGGYAWEKAGRIWYRTLISNQLKPIAKFRRFARISEDVTTTMYGHGSEEHKIVRESWKDVGVNLP